MRAIVEIDFVGNQPRGRDGPWLRQKRLLGTGNLEQTGNKRFIYLHYLTSRHQDFKNLLIKNGTLLLPTAKLHISFCYFLF